MPDLEGEEYVPPYEEPPDVVYVDLLNLNRVPGHQAVLLGLDRGRCVVKGTGGLQWYEP